jgi:hypothetical protein
VGAQQLDGGHHLGGRGRGGDVAEELRATQALALQLLQDDDQRREASEVEIEATDTLGIDFEEGMCSLIGQHKPAPLTASIC